MYLNRNNFIVKDREKVDFLNKYYEFCYLESMHYYNLRQKTDTIITGLSYGINGLESKMIGENTLNFSMHSQDLYYDFLHIKRAIENSVSISQCIITLGYYSLYYDLSLSSSKIKCITTYMPLFSDMHHVKEAEVPRNFIFQYLNEVQEFAHQFFKDEKSYYGKAILREHTNPILRSRGGWLKLTLEERDKMTYQLVEKHNKHMKHAETFKENVKILNDMMTFLNEHHVRTIVVVLPFSKEYLKYINPLYKESIMQVLEESPYPIDFMDMNDEIIFTEEDILDSDHLNLRGAKKASLLVKGIIENVL